MRLLCLERSSPELFVVKCMGFTCAIEKSRVHISQELVLRRHCHEGSRRGASPEMLRSVPDPAFLSSPAETSWNRSPRAPRLHACARLRTPTGAGLSGTRTAVLQQLLASVGAVGLAPEDRSACASAEVGAPTAVRRGRGLSWPPLESIPGTLR